MFSLSACDMGLGLAHNAFDQSNAMIALLSKSKFSAKDITLYANLFFNFEKTLLFILLYGIIITTNICDAQASRKFQRYLEKK